MTENFGAGVVGAIVLIDPVTGLPYRATGSGGDWTSLANKPTTFPPEIGTGAAQAVAGNDARLTNARVPLTHKTSHATGGSDPLTAADIGAATTASVAALSTSVATATQDRSAYATGAYSVVNGRIVSPLGADTMVNGMHITVPSMGDNGDCLTRSDELLDLWSVKDASGTAISKPTAVYLDCGVVSDVRLPVWWPALARVTPTVYKGETLPQWKVDILQRVDEYTAAGLIVIVTTRDSMNATGTLSDIATSSQITDFFVWLVGKYKTNPLVWVNPHCEPPKTDQTWCDMHNMVIDAVRAAGYVGPIIVDPPTAGQDVGPEYTTFNPFGSTWLQLVNASGSATVTGITNKANLVNGLHVYGWPTWQRSYSAFLTYVNNHKTAGFPVVFGEFGAITTNTRGSTIDLDTSDRVKATHAAFDLIRARACSGGVWWHGHHADDFSLLTSNQAFWAKAADGSNLTWAGQKFMSVLGAQV